MEKNNKKVIISTIIAVVFLVTLIVSATYAYFNASNNASGTTNLDATTETIGNVVVTNPTENLYLKLSASDMQESNKGNSYFATNDSNKNYAITYRNNLLANYLITDGGEETIYNCKFKFNIIKPPWIRSGDMKLELKLAGVTIDGNQTFEVDLSNAASNYEIEFTKKGNGSGPLIYGDIIFNNTTSNQLHLVGKTLHVGISNSDLECEVINEMAPGVYDDNNVMLASWDELVNNYGLDLAADKDRPGWADPTNTSTWNYVINNNANLANATKLVTGNNLSKIGNFTFYDDNLKSLILSDSVEIVGDNTINIDDLTNLEIGAGLKNINAFSFYANYASSSLATINVDKKNQIYDSRNDCNALIETATNTLIFASNNTVIPNNITKIGIGAFSGAKIKHLEIPNSVITIEGSAFSMSQLQTIVIPKSVVSIGDWAFEDLQGPIYYTGSEEEWNSIVFGQGVLRALEKAKIIYNYEG